MKDGPCISQLGFSLDLASHGDTLSGRGRSMLRRRKSLLVGCPQDVAAGLMVVGASESPLYVPSLPLLGNVRPCGGPADRGVGAGWARAGRPRLLY